ncbi:MAG: Sua5 family C-terminal domain-containing protein [Vicinamibacterales bacterium]
MALAPELAPLAATGRVHLQAYGTRANPEAAAAELFHALRRVDDERPDVILASGVGVAGLGAAIRDRLLRAAEGRRVVLHSEF